MNPSTYAIIGQDQVTVSNVIVATPSVQANLYPGAILIDGLDPSPAIGWRYDQASKTFSQN